MNGHIKRRGTGKSYIRIRINGKRIYLHRYLVNRFIQPLKDSDIVHHIDGNKHNNSLDNLAVCRDRAHHLAEHNYYKSEKCLPKQARLKLEMEKSEFAEIGW